MTDKRGKRLTRKGEPSQKTDKGLEIPIPKRGEFMRNLRRASKTGDSETKRRPKQ
jgi:hypothetical protein